jgi:hypothetical protein
VTLSYDLEKDTVINEVKTETEELYSEISADEIKKRERDLRAKELAKLDKLNNISH